MPALEGRRSRNMGDPFRAASQDPVEAKRKRANPIGSQIRLSRGQSGWKLRPVPNWKQPPQPAALFFTSSPPFRLPLTSHSTAPSDLHSSRVPCRDRDSDRPRCAKFSGKMKPTPTIHDFDFGVSVPLELPADEPSPSRWLMYTAWHVNRALEYYQRTPVAEGHTIPLILTAFKVWLLTHTRLAQLTRIRNSKLSAPSSHFPA